MILITLAAASFAMYFGIQRAIEDTVDTQLEVRSDSVEHFLKQTTAGCPDAAPGSCRTVPGCELYQITVPPEPYSSSRQLCVLEVLLLSGRN